MLNLNSVTGDVLVRFHGYAAQPLPREILAYRLVFGKVISLVTRDRSNVLLRQSNRS